MLVLNYCTISYLHIIICVHASKISSTWSFMNISIPFLFPITHCSKRTCNLQKNSPVKLSPPDHRMRVFGHQSEKCEAILCTLSAVWFACCIPIVYSPFFVFVFIFFLHLFTAVDYYNPFKLTNVYKCYIILLATARAKIYSFYIDLLSRGHDTSEYPPTGCRFLQVLNPTSDSYEFNWMLEEVDKDVAPQPGAMPFRCLTKYLDVWIPPRWYGQLDGRCGSLVGRFRFWRSRWRLNWGPHCRPCRPMFSNKEKSLEMHLLRLFMATFDGWRLRVLEYDKEMMKWIFREAWKKLHIYQSVFSAFTEYWVTPKNPILNHEEIAFYLNWKFMILKS